MNKYAYLRVSTKDQNIDRQLLALDSLRYRKNINIDYQSSKDFNRPADQSLMKALKQGDLHIIKSIDRLGRILYDSLPGIGKVTRSSF